MQDESSKPSFFKTYVLSTVLLFALPLITYGFCAYATHRQNGEFREWITGELSTKMLADEGAKVPQSEVDAFLEALPPAAELCRPETKLDPEIEPLRQSVAGDFCDRFEQFDLVSTVAVGTMALGAFIWLVAMLSAFVAHQSTKLQYPSFVTGWWVLRLTGTLLLLLQGAMLVWLSYWLFAFFLNLYSVKLILMVGIGVLLAVYVAVKAILTTPDLGVHLSGAVLPREQAPLLWKRIDDRCAALNTSPPKNLILGIDENFFVTEADVHVEQVQLSGRTLYASVSLLSVLTSEEAEAVLAHEMAHFSGGDIEYAQKLSPKMASFENYLEAIRIAYPVYVFMGTYYVLFAKAIRKDDRLREFRADKTAAEQVSPKAVANSLIKVSGYASYRHRVHNELFERDSVHDELKIAQRIKQGIESYAKSEFAQDISSMSIPHPFDSHPLLKERIEAVGLQIDESSYGDILVSKGDSWYGDIQNAAQIEERLWESFEQEFATDHERSLAFRYLPSTPEETEIVLKHFPDTEFLGAKTGDSLHLSYSEARWHEWPGVVELKNIKKTQWTEGSYGHQLAIKLHEPVGGKSTLKISSRKLADFEDFQGSFELYLLRVREAELYQAAQRAAVVEEA